MNISDIRRYLEQGLEKVGNSTIAASKTLPKVMNILGIAYVGYHLLADENKAPLLLGLTGGYLGNKLSPKSPWYVATIARMGGFVLGNAIGNTLTKNHSPPIAGMDENGMGAILRKQDTDFGSGLTRTMRSAGASGKELLKQRIRSIPNLKSAKEAALADRIITKEIGQEGIPAAIPLDYYVEPRQAGVLTGTGSSPAKKAIEKVQRARRSLTFEAGFPAAYRRFTAYSGTNHLESLQSIEEGIAKSLRGRDSQLVRTAEDFRRSSPKHSLYRYSHPDIEGMRKIGVSGQNRIVLGWMSGWDVARRFIGVLGKDIGEVVASSRFQAGLREGRVIRRLGRGGAGTVELMETTIAGERFRYARKTYSNAHLKGEAIREAEAIGLKPLESSIAPTVYGIESKSAANPSMFMEYIEGTTLEEAFKTGSQKLTKGHVKTLKSAVEKLHGAGITHTDITLKNIMVTKGGDVALIDPMPFRHAGKGTTAQSELLLQKIRLTQDEIALSKLAEVFERPASWRMSQAKTVQEQLWSVSNAPAIAQMSEEQARKMGVSSRRYQMAKQANQEIAERANADLAPKRSLPISPVKAKAVAAGESLETVVEGKSAAVRKRQQIHDSAARQARNSFVNPGRRHREMDQLAFTDTLMENTLMDPLQGRRGMWEQWQRHFRR